MLALEKNEKGHREGGQNFIHGRGTAGTMAWNPCDKDRQVLQSRSQQLQNVFPASPFSQTLARMVKGDVGRDIQRKARTE